jgi:anti-sigma factor RsiW
MTTPLNGPCERCDEFLSNSLDAPLDRTEQAELDAHLARCPACVQRMRETLALTAALRALGRLEETEAAPPIPESLVSRILAARAAEVSKPATRRRSG